ncbi:hypothetical protein LJPFL01_2173 [Lelliottia jeotgali]|nr:hypothetical protein LJPFL01_2173 [Lelliottia jeotgali]
MGCHPAALRLREPTGFVGRVSEAPPGNNGTSFSFRIHISLNI